MYSNFNDTANDFIKNSLIIAKLRKKWKKKKNFKTGSNSKQSTPGEIKKHEEQMAGLIGS